MIRNVGAVVAGLVVGSVLNLVVIGLNSTVLFPAPAGMDFSDPVAMGAYLAELPLAAWLVVVLAHLLQAFAGGWVAARLGTRPVPLALVIGGLSALGGVANLLSIPAPAWMWLEVPLYFVVAWGAGAIEQRRRG